MNRKKTRGAAAALALAMTMGWAGAAALHAQAAQEGAGPAETAPRAGWPAGAGSAGAGTGGAGGTLPLRRVSLFSSGVGFFEHQGQVAGTEAAPGEITLSFNAAAVNDALKSLLITDPLSKSPAVRYPSEETLPRTLKSLSVDLSENPSVPDILGSLAGAWVDVSAPSLISGRILGVEDRPAAAGGGGGVQEKWLSLATAEGIRAVAVKDIASFSFKDDVITRDLNRALDLIMASRNDGKRGLQVSLPGTGSREVTVSYVIPAPVWKVSYRLDLTGDKPYFQGWAIVDNDSDTDWRDVRLSLVTGRPVSFTQNLYAPYRTVRPVLPLAIAGAAESRTYESGWAGGAIAGDAKAAKARGAFAAAEDSLEEPEPLMGAAYDAATPRPEPAPAPMARNRPLLAASGASTQTARGNAAGDQFEFTLPRPVTLERRQSAMLPLAEGPITAEKTLVLSGDRLSGGASAHPAVSAEITNTTGIRLPAGPLTVYDGGAYAGDALIAFLSENEKRLISYGEDLSVTGSAAFSPSRSVTGVAIASGVMTIQRKQRYERVYTVQNASGEDKRLIIEHPATAGATLAEPSAWTERTASAYRFSMSLKASSVLSFTVIEEAPLSEQVVLARLRPETFAAFAADGELPEAARTALAKAVELKRNADSAEEAQGELEAKNARLAGEQERIRKNLEAAGNQSPQGQEYLKRLAALDGEIDALNAAIEEAGNKTREARKAYSDYLASLKL